MQVFDTITALRRELALYRHQRIALVPTMGNLHDGHLALVQAAKRHADVVVVSIFVNPTQFGAGEDFDSYPRTLAADVAKLKTVAADLVFAPSVGEMYAKLPPSVSVLVGDISQILCGRTRPTHFDGVGLVVSKLLNIVQPDVAVFGKKDYQQLAIIRQLVAELNFNVAIIGVEVQRAPDGLALSSRNQYLTADERAHAPYLQQCLQQLATQLQTAAFADFTQLVDHTVADLNASGFRVDYVEVRAQSLAPATANTTDLVILAAAWLGKARLLDNVEVTRKQ